MFHCNNSVVTTARLDTATTLVEGAVVPGILTAKTLQGVLLGARQRTVNDEAESGDEILSPYGKMPRQVRKTRYRNQPNDFDLLQTALRPKPEVVVRRKRCRKLDPMPAVMSRCQGQSNLAASISRNQTSSGDTELDVLDEQRIVLLRSDLNQTSLKLQRDGDRLKREILWIHGHFPVLKLANAKCSRNLRQQLFRNAVVHISINFMRRKALLYWYQKLLDAQRKERMQLSVSRRLIAMFENVSLDHISGKFDSWGRWVVECQTQENMAAAITIQRFARFLQSRREERENAEQKEALVKALEALSRNAKTIQRAYRQHRRNVEQRQCESAERKTQRIEMRRTAYNGFVKRQNGARLIQRNYRVHSKRRSCRREREIAILFDKSREKNARRIQNAWLGYKAWRECELPVEIVEALVDQVEFDDAVLTIQRHLRGFQCRFRMRKKNSSASSIQNCWRAGKRRETSRTERQMMILRRDIAASCLQRTFRRIRAERKIHSDLHRSTRPLYLRARHLGESFREQFRLRIAKSAIVAIQSTWRRHVAYEKDKQRKRAAGATIRRFLKRVAILSKWRSSVIGARRRRRDEVARTLQRWIRRLHHHQTHFIRRRPSVVYVLEQISAATKIQLWYRHRRSDLWQIILTRLLAEELPRCIEAVKRISRCWKAYLERKQEHMRQADTIADLIERQRRAESENRAAKIIQRRFKRRIDQRNGKLLLQKYKILLREDIKRRQQRVIVHKYLEEKSQQRKTKQEVKAATRAARQISVESSIGSPQVLSLDSYTTEASAFSLDETPYDTSDSAQQATFADSTLSQTQGPIQYWSEEYQRAYLYDPVTGVSTWL